MLSCYQYKHYPITFGLVTPHLAVKLLNVAMRSRRRVISAAGAIETLGGEGARAIALVASLALVSGVGWNKI